MITNNLKNLLEKENLSINKVSKDTGISRPSLTALANNESSGIQFETLETLVSYFQIPISSFLQIKDEQTILVFQSVIPLDSIKDADAVEITQSKLNKKFVAVKPSDTMVFDAKLVHGKENSKTFSIAISPYKNGNKIMGLTIVFYRYDSEGKEISTSDLTGLLAKLNKDAIIDMTISFIDTWQKYYEKVESLEDLFLEMFMIDITVANKKTRIPVIATVTKENGEHVFNFELFQKHSPAKGNKKFSDNFHVQSVIV